MFPPDFGTGLRDSTEFCERVNSTKVDQYLSEAGTSSSENIHVAATIFFHFTSEVKDSSGIFLSIVTLVELCSIFL